MPIPLDKLIAEDRNIYQVTTAVIRRAHQLGEIRRAFSANEHGSVTEEGDKVVSRAIEEILEEEVQYRIGES